MSKLGRKLDWTIKEVKEHFNIIVKKCPCCGEHKDASYNEKTEVWRGLDIGVCSSDTFGIRCLTCRVELSRSYPENIKNNITKGIDLDDPMACEKVLERAKHHTLKLAIKAWNRRS